MFKKPDEKISRHKTKIIFHYKNPSDYSLTIHFHSYPQTKPTMQANLNEQLFHSKFPSNPTL